MDEFAAAELFCLADDRWTGSIWMGSKQPLSGKAKVQNSWVGGVEGGGEGDMLTAIANLGREV